MVLLSETQKNRRDMGSARVRVPSEEIAKDRQYSISQRATAREYADEFFKARSEGIEGAVAENKKPKTIDDLKQIESETKKSLVTKITGGASEKEILERKGSISAPKVSTDYAGARARNIEGIRRDLPAPVDTALFGLGGEGKGIQGYLKSKGFLGVAEDMAFGSLAKTEDNLIFEKFRDLKAAGADDSRAIAIARGEAIPTTGAEKGVLQNYAIEKGFDGLFVVLDALTLRKASSLRSGSRAFVENLAKNAATAPNSVAARKLIADEYKLPAGADAQLQEIVELLRNPDSIKNGADLEYKIKQVVDSVAVEPRQVEAATDVQRVVYENGVPVIKFGEEDTTALLSITDELSAANRGLNETARLSNPGVLASEIKAGTVPFKTTAEGTVEVFSLGRDTTQLKPGMRLTSVSDLADEGARLLTANVSDLVRLSDGTLAYAPKLDEAIQTGLDQALRGIRGTRVAEVQKAAKARSVEQATKAREIITKKKAFEAEEKARRAQEASDIKKGEEAVVRKEAHRQRMVDAMEEGKTVTAKVMRDAERGVMTAQKIIQDNVGAVAGIQRRTAELVKALTQKAGTPNKVITKKFGKFLTVSEKQKLSRGGELTTFERARIKKRVLKNRDEEIANVKDKVSRAQETARLEKSEVARLKTVKDKGTKAEEFLKVDKPFPQGKVVSGEKAVTKEKAVPGEKALTKEKVVIKEPSASEEKTYLVGTKSIKRTSVFHEQMASVKKLIGDAETLEPSFTHRKGTDFVEQTERGLKFLDEHGFEETLRIAREETNDFISNKGIKRSTLKSVLETVLKQSDGLVAYQDDLMAITRKLEPEVSEAAQIMSLARMAQQNSPFKIIVDIERSLKSNVKFSDTKLTAMKKEIEDILGKDIDLSKLTTEAIDSIIC